MAVGDGVTDVVAVKVGVGEMVEVIDAGMARATWKFMQYAMWAHAVIQLPPGRTAGSVPWK